MHRFVLNFTLFLAAFLVCAPSRAQDPDWFQNVKKAFSEKNIAKAREEMKKGMSRLSPAALTEEMRYFAAELETDWNKALAAFRELAAGAESEWSARAQKTLGDRALAADRLEEAKEAYRIFLKRFSDHPSAWSVRLSLAGAEEASGEYDAALKDALAVAEGGGEQLEPKARLQAARILVKKGSYPQAQEQLLILFDRFADWEEIDAAWVLSAQTYEAAGDIRKAHTAWKTAYLRSPIGWRKDLAAERMKVLEAKYPELSGKKEADSEKEENQDTSPLPVVWKESGGSGKDTKSHPESSPAGDAREKEDRFFVQAGVFLDAHNAERMENRLKENGYDALTVVVQAPDRPYPYYKVRVPAGETRDAARRLAREVSSRLEIAAFVVEGENRPGGEP